MNFYALHIGDYLKATTHLSWDEDLAYRRLLDTYYSREAPLPPELAATARLVRAAGEAQQAAVRTVLEEFFTLTPAGWTHQRCDEEIAKAAVKRSRAADAAQRRWQRPVAQSDPEQAGAPIAASRSEFVQAAPEQTKAHPAPPRSESVQAALDQAVAAAAPPRSSSMHAVSHQNGAPLAPALSLSMPADPDQAEAHPASRPSSPARASTNIEKSQFFYKDPASADADALPTHGERSPKAMPMHDGRRADAMPMHGARTAAAMATHAKSGPNATAPHGDRATHASATHGEPGADALLTHSQRGAAAMATHIEPDARAMPTQCAGNAPNPNPNPNPIPIPNPIPNPREKNGSAAQLPDSAKLQRPAGEAHIAPPAHPTRAASTAVPAPCEAAPPPGLTRSEVVQAGARRASVPPHASPAQQSRAAPPSVAAQQSRAAPASVAAQQPRPAPPPLAAQQSRAEPPRIAAQDAPHASSTRPGLPGIPDPPASIGDWSNFFSRQQFSPDALQQPSVRAAFAGWVDKRVGLQLMAQAMRQGDARLGKRPGLPSYYANFVAELLRPPAAPVHPACAARPPDAPPALPRPAIEAI